MLQKSINMFICQYLNQLSTISISENITKFA